MAGRGPAARRPAGGGGGGGGGGNWATALTDIARTKDPVDENLPKETLLVSHDEYTITIMDKYPKSTFHLLILPRIPFLLQQGHCEGPSASSAPPSLSVAGGKLTLGSTSSGKSVPSSHLKDISTLLASPYAAEVLAALRRASDTAVRIIQDHMRSTKLPGQTEECGVTWGTERAFHAIPSMQTVHLHVYSSDLVSDSLKNAKHYNSFSPQHGFAVSLDLIEHMVTQGFKALPHTPAFYEAMLKHKLVGRDGQEYRNLPLLKAHLEQAWRAEVDAAVKRQAGGAATSNSHSRQTMGDCPASGNDEPRHKRQRLSAPTEPVGRPSHLDHNVNHQHFEPMIGRGGAAMGWEEATYGLAGDGDRERASPSTESAYYDPSVHHFAPTMGQGSSKTGMGAATYGSASGDHGNKPSAVTDIARTMDPVDDNLPPEIRLIHHDQWTITIMDKVPMAKIHLLVIPRMPFLLHQGHGKGNQRDDTYYPLGSHDPHSNGQSVPFAHLRDISSLLASPYAADVLAALRRASDRAVQFIEDQMRKTKLPGKNEECGVTWGIERAFHAVPTMQTLHLHVYSSDLLSRNVSNKWLYNSFSPQRGFAISLDLADHMVAEGFKALPYPPPFYEGLLKQKLVGRDGHLYRNLPPLKAHLEQAWRADVEAAAKRRGTAGTAPANGHSKDAREDSPTASHGEPQPVSAPPDHASSS